MRLHRPHPWPSDPREALRLQRELAPRVRADVPLDLAAIRLVAGVDVSVREHESRAAIVVTTFPGLAIVETVFARAPTPMPYVPGLLSFREGPVLEAAFEKLEATPDAFLFDGQGLAHPRRVGIACHMGLWLERPTIGVGKSILCGRHGPVPNARGASTPLVHRGETVGALLRTRERVAPVVVSPGHLADLPGALALAMALTGRYRLPEPIRAAHKAAGAFVPGEGEET